MECECRQIAVSFDKDGAVTDVHCIACHQEYEPWTANKTNRKSSLKKIFASPISEEKI